MKTISIIWAWAAGLMAAATILEANHPDVYIHIFDKNSAPWRKVAISWGWRCNLTTSIDDKKELLSKYTRGSEFIKKALGKFSPKKCREWFMSHNLELKAEDDWRVFPLSDNGLDVVEVFENIFAKYRNNLEIHYSESVTEVMRGGEGRFHLKTKKASYSPDFLVITTGGNAYSQTGSTGDGYDFARTLWHTITQLGPSLSSFLTRERWIHELSWMQLENAKIGNYIHSLLFTHFGISWPLAFMVSSEYAWENISKEKPLIIKLVPIASMNFPLWDEFLKEQFGLHPKKWIISILSEKFPKRFSEWFIGEFFPELVTVFASSISRAHRESIARLLWDGFPITLIERRPGDEFVTAGWVDTDQIYPETLESKIQKNLYFAGEVLNVDAVTGGFNLQGCWAWGYVVGKSILESIIQKD